MNFFIMHLALADLLVGLVSVLPDIIWRMTVSWVAGNLACKAVRFMQAVVIYSSTYVLVALSIDRLDAITRPMNFSGSWRRAKLLVIASWLISFLFSSPIMVLYEEREIQGRLQCWIELGEPWQWRLYMSLVTVTVFLVPAIVIAVCYAVIVHTIWTKSRHLMPPPPPPHSNGDLLNGHHATSPLTNCDHPDGEVELRRASSRGIIPRAKIKTVKMTFVIVFVFVVCWCPYLVFDLLQVWGFVPRTQTSIAVATFIQSLAPLNSAANPLIYCLFSTHVCRAIRKIPVLKWLWCGTSTSGASEVTTESSQRMSASASSSSNHRQNHKRRTTSIQQFII
ncbi:cardioacceleratory peptide receptor [Nilaparvata lugens]|uniref:cardioacceleratory peptide receptor n=1 Tax=Nilaparvata lugens TaxID=108931 RepID=UPI00193E13CA|nr:cardioacceleratory peptide receptor [Nilaparvata lugens]